MSLGVSRVLFHTLSSSRTFEVPRLRLVEVNESKSQSDATVFFRIFPKV